MLPQKSQAAFKFVIKSKLTAEQVSGNSEQTSVPTPQPPPILPPAAATKPPKQQQHQPSGDVASTKQSPPETKSCSDDIERKRKRNDKDILPLASKKMHCQLQRWNQKHAELKVQEAQANNNGEEEEEDDEADRSLESSTAPSLDFADLTIMACLLCQRKFKTIQDLQRHQEISQLHKKNLQDPACVEKAKSKMRDLKTEADQQAERNYRNRAAERRQAYGQPEKPVLPSTGGFQHKRASRTLQQLQRQVDKTTTSASIEKPITDDNVGARMLQQMGWRRGEGLGKDAAGIVNPIAAEQYAQGAGLGSAHAKRSISPTTSGSDNYKDRVKEMARRRYEEEQQQQRQD